jgi:hypothetical protein
MGWKSGGSAPNGWKLHVLDLGRPSTKTGYFSVAAPVGGTEASLALGTLVGTHLRALDVLTLSGFASFPTFLPHSFFFHPFHWIDVSFSTQFRIELCVLPEVK